MCSLNKCGCSDNDDAFTNVKDSLIDKIVCRKCKCENVDILLVGQSGYCKPCFLTATTHKFRATIGKSKVIRHKDSILVDHSGEVNSTVLLHLIKAGMSESAQKKLTFKATILYIDDCTIMKATNEERDILRHKIAEQVENFGFNGYVIPLSQILNKEDALDIRPINSKEINNENDDKLFKILTNLPDETARTDLLSQLRRKLLIMTAQKINCNKIFIADSSMDIATKVLGDICLGRGTQLSSIANFCDSRCANVEILKPIRDFTKQELIYYSDCYKLNPIKMMKNDIVTPVTAIQTLAHKFIAELEAQSSGTVSTIFRTAEKLSARETQHQNIEDTCALCDANLDFVPPDNQVSAMRAFEISKLVSCSDLNTKTSSNDKKNTKLHCKNSQSSSQKCCDTNRGCHSKDSNKEQIIPEDIWRFLCYSCRSIFRNTETLHILPIPLLHAIQQKLALTNMKDQINEFLL